MNLSKFFVSRRPRNVITKTQNIQIPEGTGGCIVYAYTVKQRTYERPVMASMVAGKFHITQERFARGPQRYTNRKQYFFIVYFLPEGNVFDILDEENIAAFELL